MYDTFGHHVPEDDAPVSSAIWATRVLLEDGVATKLASHDPEVLNLVLASLGPQLARYVYSLCGQRHEAEDVVQEALMTVCVKLSQLRRPTHVKPWAFRIARNLVWMRRRKGTLGGARDVRLDADGAWRDRGISTQVRAAYRSPDHIAFLSEMRNLLGAAIQELPEIYRAVVLLRDVDGLSTVESAAILNVSTDTVKTRLHRAHVELRAMLAAYRLGNPSRDIRVKSRFACDWRSPIG